MRDSILVQEDEVGDHVIERRRVQSLLQLASDNILEKFVPPRSVLYRVDCASIKL